MKNLKELVLILTFSSMVVSGYGQNLIPTEQPTAVENQLFGYAISVSDWRAVVSAPQKDIAESTSLGSAFFYERTETGWEIKTEITPTGLPAFSNFGIAAKLAGNTALISSLGSERGILMEESVFVYEHNDTSWVNTQVLRPSDSKPGLRFGYSLDIAEHLELAIVGAHQADGNEPKSGAAYLFERQEGIWVQIAKLVAEDGEPHDFFGYTVLFLDGNQIAVGAYNATGANERSGAVYIFEKDENEDWIQAAKLFDPNGSSSDLFGYTLATQIGVPIPVKASSFYRFGTLFIGAPGSNNENGVQTGSVYFYDQQEGIWNLTSEFFDESSEANDHFGISIAHNSLSGLFIGANRTGTNKGKIYSYGYYHGEEEVTPFAFEGNTPEPDIQYYGSRISSNSSADIIIASPYSSVSDKNNSGVVQFYNTPITPNEEEIEVVEEYMLEQNYPNPFNPSTQINYQVKEAGLVKLSVFNLLGQEVQTLVNEQKTNGAYSVNFDASALSSGFYFYRLEVNDFVSVKKMMLIK
ncbi:MAG: T9SS type A sorting domain-containing protein [Balneolaceae bacterium]|nr:T9SS type A sorting domain-containing protein [Balneolaceae bacterium]MBO6546775.1 T9SS type A sorting domain-containing protein [Balneolaceae bacterium]MBO6649135.1 T9SS type A sorting domain-containing protein [Balneolaceae bacterium]